MRTFPHDAWLRVAYACGGIKVLATVAQLAWRPGAVEITKSRLGRALYIAGKVSPIGFVGALLIRAVRLGSPDAADLSWGLAATVLLVAGVVVLRTKRQWYGVAHMVRSRDSSGGA